MACKSVEELLTSLDAQGALSLDGEADRKDEWTGDPYKRSRRLPPVGSVLQAVAAKLVLFLARSYHILPIMHLGVYD